MTTIATIFFVIAAILLNTSATPLFQGISFQRGFEINFKPWPRKPIAFIREKWSPLGVFGKKFAIQKRSLDDIVPPGIGKPVAPVFEHIEELEHIGNGPLYIIPRAPIINQAQSLRPPLPINSAINLKDAPPLPVPLPIIVNDNLPPKPTKSDAVPPVFTNMIEMQPTKVMNSHIISSATGLYTDISRVESTKEHIVKLPPELPGHPPPPPIAPVPVVPIPHPPVVIPPPVPPKEPVPHAPPSPIPAVPVLPELEINGELKDEVKEVVKEEVKEKEKEVVKEEIKEIVKEESKEEKTEFFLKDSPLVKGSKVALRFGTVFLTLMAQFFDSARASIDLFTNPPPKFNN